MDLITLLQYSFIQKAFIAGSLIGITCAVLGIFLVLKRMSLIGDGIAHLSFGGIALGLLLGIYPIYIALPVAILGSLFIVKISQKAKIFGDAAIGIISAGGISLGVIMASLSKGFNVDLFSYLFGNILAISDSELLISVLLSLIVLAILYFFYWDLFSSTFDEEYAKVTGIKTGFLNTLLAILTSVIIVLSVKVVGVMMVSALLVLPAITSLQISKNFKSSLLLSSILSIVSILTGIVFSFILDIPTGATIVMLNIVFFIVSLLIKKA